jgi:sirohydrochlorin ferrochelatase
VVLVAHGSRDPRSADTVRHLADRVADRWPAPVTAAFLDFNQPTVPDVLRGLRDQVPVVVPLLLTRAYHGRVDVPTVLAAAGGPTRLAGVLGPAGPREAPDPRLLAALTERLSSVDDPGGDGLVLDGLVLDGLVLDGLVLIAAGTSDAVARSTVESVAAVLGRRLDVPYAVGYASGSAATAGAAVSAVRARGARRVLVASYFLAPGLLYDAAVASARAAGADAVAAPLGASDAMAELVLTRVRAAADEDAPVDRRSAGASA